VCTSRRFFSTIFLFFDVPQYSNRFDYTKAIPPVIYLVTTKKSRHIIFNLLGNLSKVVNEADGGCSLERVVDGVDVNVALVEQMMEYVDGFHGSRTLLLVAKYQIDPLVQASTHIVTLQSLHDTTNIKSGRLQSVDAAGESTKQASGLQTVCSRFTILRLSLTCSDSMDHCSLVGEPTI